MKKEKTVESETNAVEDGMTIDDTLKELEAIIEKLESSDSSLEESFQYYEKGMKLVKSCSEMIDQVEKQILVLNEGGEEDER